jgi:hypothetical protein
MLTIEDLEQRSEQINARLEAIFEEIVDGNKVRLSMEAAQEIVNLLLEAQKIGKTLSYREILVSNHCSGPH